MRPCRLPMLVLSLVLWDAPFPIENGWAADSNGPGAADSSRYVDVDGFAVHGYADGKEIGYDWFETEGEALEAKAKMEMIKVTNGLYYDKVEIKPERRRILRPRSTPATPTPPSDPAPPNVVRPGGGVTPPPAPPSLKGTTWVGSETASDTTSLTFIFKEDGTVTAHDDLRKDWRGRWRMVGDKTVVIELTYPHAVNYSGQISGTRISGKAGQPQGRGQWNWSVQFRPQQQPPR